MRFRLLPRPASPPRRSASAPRRIAPARPGRALAPALAALLCAVAASPAIAGFSDGTIPDGIAACEGNPYDIVERDGDLYIACYGTPLDWMRFSASVSVDADDAVARITVTRTGAGSGRRALLRWSTADGSARASRDYAAVFNAPLFFDDLETSRTVTVPLLDDPAADAPRRFTVAFSNGASQNLVVPRTEAVTLPFAVPAGPAPQLAGRARAGATLTVTAGPWSPAADAVAWQWERCDADGAGCAPVDDATAATLTLGAGDAGHRMRVVATATNAAGATTVASAPSDIVGPPQTEEPGPGTGEPGTGEPGTGEPGTGGPGPATGQPGAGEPGTSGPVPDGQAPGHPDGGSGGAGGAVGPGDAGAGGPRPGRPARSRPGAGRAAPRRPAGRRVVTTATVRFCAGCWRPSARDRARLERLRAQVRGARLVRVVGHADASGERGANVRLAGRRARVVARLLLDGPAAARPRRVELRNAGISRPAAPNATLAGRALNRRVTIRIVTRGR